MSGANNSAPIIVKFDKVIFFDSPVRGIRGTYSSDPIEISIDFTAVVSNVVYGAVLSIAFRVEAVASVRRE